MFQLRTNEQLKLEGKSESPEIKAWSLQVDESLCKGLTKQSAQFAVNKQSGDKWGHRWAGPNCRCHRDSFRVGKSRGVLTESRV